jgi:hypothetical protein
MTRKAEFNAEEWSSIVEGPVLAGMRVAMAARGGTIRESLAMGETYARARREHGQSDLLDDIVSAPPAMDPSRLPSRDDVGRVTAQRLREAVALLEGKASPEEVDAYKRFVMTLAEATWICRSPASARPSSPSTSSTRRERVEASTSAGKRSSAA